MKKNKKYFTLFITLIILSVVLIASAVFMIIKSDPSEDSIEEQPPEDKLVTTVFAPQTSEKTNENDESSDLPEIPEVIPSKISVEGSVLWNDDENRDGIRPENVTVELFMDGELISSGSVTAADSWQWVFSDLDEYKNNSKIVYTVAANQIEGYTTINKENQITYTHSPSIISVSGAAIWNDNEDQDGKRPDSLTVNLLENDTIIKSSEVSEFNGWAWSFPDLYEYHDGNKINYTINCCGITDYITEINGFDILNSYETETVEIKGSVTWNDNNNQDGKRPESITINLFADDTIIASKKVTATDGWIWTFTNLDAYKKGERINYTISIEQIADYSTEVNGFDIINRYETETVSVKGSATWKDNNNQDGKRPTSITINLLADGNIIASKKVTASEGWKWTFTNLDAYKNGKKINYTITVATISDYKTTINGYNLTNTHQTEQVTVSGIVEWLDNNNKNGRRPESITVFLYADGNAIYQQTITASNSWTWSFSNLDKYSNGKKITYTINEKSIDGYTTVVEDNNITNILIPEAQKEDPQTDTTADRPNTDSTKPATNTEMENLVSSAKPAQITILKPVASGILTTSNAEATIDYSNTKDGYVMVKYTSATTAKLKAQIKGPTGTTYTYNLSPEEWTVLPLSDGNGEYSIKLFKNVIDNKYSLVLALSDSVKMDDEFAPFLRPNQYVNYENATETMATAARLLNDNMSILTKVETVYNYISENIIYDYAKSSTVQSGYLPDLDKVLQEKKGICFDYAALMTSMLRSQNIPCKLIVGYADGEYHAWINVWSPETGWIDNAIFFNGTNWQIMDPTFAAGGIMNLKNINYTSKYIY